MSTAGVFDLSRARQNHLSLFIQMNQDKISTTSAREAYFKEKADRENKITLELEMELFSNL